MISIVVPCKNRIKKLKLCIDSIKKAIEKSKKEILVSEYEIIIINDHSDEGFKENIIEQYPEVRIIDSDGIGPGYARNLGIKNSRGKYIFFTDSDCVVSDDWIVVGYNSFIESKSLVIQGIPWLFQKNENQYLGSQEEKLYELMFSTYLIPPYTTMTDSRNLLINKDIVNIMGNEVFSEKSNKATAESRVFGKRCNSYGIQILFNENVKIYHEDSLNMESVCNQKYRHGSGRVEIWNEKPDFQYLKSRYFENPINFGVDKKYILPSHFAFLLGYYQNLNDKEELNKFLKFSEHVFEEYGEKISNFDYIMKMI